VSNGTPPITGTNLTHPTSGNTHILLDIKTAIKKVGVKGLREIFDTAYSEYTQFQNLKIDGEYPVKNEDVPCVTVSLQNLRVRQAGIARITRNLIIQISPSERIVIREEKRVFEAKLVLYHCTYAPAELARLSDALVDAITFDPGGTLMKYVDANVTGIAYGSDDLPFTGEIRELAPEGGERYMYSDSLSIPIWGEIVMRASYGRVTEVEVRAATVGADDIVIVDYPAGWDW